MPRIYTRTGDEGKTGLQGGTRVSKDHPRIRALGDIDELNSLLGVASAALPKDKAYASFHETLARVQGELLTVGALLSSPRTTSGMPAKTAAALEKEIDRLEEVLEPLRAFILPGGTLPGALLHQSRAVCRRAEREAVALSRGATLPSGVLAYLNRLSDFLFTAARWANHDLGRREDVWSKTLRRPHVPA